jgi:hypothetical protein
MWEIARLELDITLSAPEGLINQARKRATAKGTTLNQEFRDWLASQTIDNAERLLRYQRLMKQLSHVDAGRHFTREEMNER